MPLTDGSAALKLQHAERHLAELERMLPVESQRREVVNEIASAERRLKLAEEKHAAALANWKSKLRALGLPDDVSPAGLATMAGQCERLAELEARIENRRDDMQRRAQWLNLYIPVMTTVIVGGLAVVLYAAISLGPWIVIMHQLSKSPI